MTSPAAPQARSDAPRVLVCGSVHLDTIVQVEEYPRPGTSVITSPGTRALGGKGANQAVASALAGARTRLAATVGEDPAADTLLAELAAVGVDTQAVQTTWDRPTGTSYIATDADGDPMIFVTSGANRLTDPADHADAIAAADIVLAQGELPPEATETLGMLANMHRTRLVLNLAPVTVVTPNLVDAADPLVVNESEAWEVLRGLGAETGIARSDLGSIVAALLHYCPSVVITMSELGAVYATAELAGGDGVARHQPAVAVPAEQTVDTTGAGDAFVGVLAAELARGRDLGAAVALGAIAGGEAVKSIGATSSYADEATLRRLLDSGVLPEATPLSQWRRPTRR